MTNPTAPALLPCDIEHGMICNELIGYTPDGKVIVRETWDLTHPRCPVAVLKLDSLEKDQNASWASITTIRPNDWDKQP